MTINLQGWNNDDLSIHTHEFAPTWFLSLFAGAPSFKRYFIYIQEIEVGYP